MKLSKKLSRLFLCGVMPLTLCACNGTGDQAVSNIVDAQKEYGCNVLNVYNAGE